MRNLGVALLISSTIACGGSNPPSPSAPSTPTPPSNRSPTITSVTVTPASGVSGLTSFSMSGTATDADNDPLTYQWSFGGTTATAIGPTVAATLTGDGDVAIRLTVTDGKGGTATDLRSVVIGTMTGRWSLLFNNNACGAVVAPVMTLTQFTGGVVTGTMESPANWCNVRAGTPGKLDPAAPASIDSQGNFTGARLKVEGFLDVFLTGKMDGTGRTVTGTSRATNGQINPFTLRKL